MTPTDTPRPLLVVRDLHVALGSLRQPVLRGVNFEVAAGKRLAVLGPSGCGKSTLLRAIAGFEHPDRGSIVLDGRTLSEGTSHVPPHRRGTGVVFQDYALFPHLSVTENIAFGLRSLARGERQRRTLELLELVGLGGLQQRKPAELSGGQQQRVALARALAPEPRLLLLDEPFSNLDSALRITTRRHTEAVLQRAGVTAILVTHDQGEAMAFADRLVVLRDGCIEQAGAPQQVYASPKNGFVARFLGAANVLPGYARGDQARTPLGRVAVRRAAEGKVTLCLRPEALSLHAPNGGVVGRVVGREYQGSFTAYQVELADCRVVVHEPGASYAVGDPVSVQVTQPAAVLDAD